MRDESRFWDRIAERYARQPIADEAAYEAKLRVTRSYFKPDMEVLELGCGTGSTALLHAPHVRHIRALDFSAKMVAIARAKAEAAGVRNVAFEQTDITRLDPTEGSYDVVLGMSILHLLNNKEALIAKVLQLLRPGGLFVSSTSCMGESRGFFKIVGPVGNALGLIPPLDVMTPSQLRDAITEAGFLIEHWWQPAKNKAVFVVARKT